jgi:hypothetical protein
MADRSVIARTKLLGLPQLLACVVLRASEHQAIAHVTEEVEQIVLEIKLFDPADFRAKEVQDRGGEPGEQESLTRKVPIHPKNVLY